MARKSKVRKVKKQKPVGLRVCDFAFPGEKSSYWRGLIGVTVLFIWLAGGAYWLLKHPGESGHPEQYYIPAYLVFYPIVAILIGNWLAAKPRNQQLKKVGRQAKVMSNNFPDLYRVLSRQASLLGMKNPPDMYVVDDPQPLMYSLPARGGAIITSQALRETLAPEEFETLLAHELTHIACKHVRTESAMTFIRSANIGVKILLFPVMLIEMFSGGWTELIDFTADRGALLTVLRPSVLNAALVKFAVVADPNAGITREELQAYIDGAGDITSDPKQIERHFKVGQFMSLQPNLRERIEQLSQFPGTTQGKEALEKMAQIQGVSLSAIPSRKTVADDVEQLIEEEGSEIPRM